MRNILQGNLSIKFFISYLVYHFQAGSVRFHALPLS